MRCFLRCDKMSCMKVLTEEQDKAKRVAAVQRVNAWREKNGRPYEYNANGLARYRKWRSENKRRDSEIHRRSKLKTLFGISEEDYEQLLVKQNGACAICEESAFSDMTKRLSIDHCHTTGKVRGLLCGRCNRGLGLFKDSSGTMLRAVAYLESHYGSTTIS